MTSHTAVSQQPATRTDRNGTYTDGVYSDGRAVRIYGRRNGFAYIAFDNDLGNVAKVPGEWVTDLELAAPADDNAAARRTVAQIAVEAIVNHPHDGWSPDDMRVVLAEAREAGVADLYVDMLAELVPVEADDADELVGIINADMIGTPAEVGERVDWSEPDVMTRSAWRELVGVDVDDYAAANPHMIAYAVTTLAKYADVKRHNYCSLPTRDVPILDEPRLCRGAEFRGITCDRVVVEDPAAGSYGMAGWVHEDDRTARHTDAEGAVLNTVTPRLRCPYCGTQDPAEVEFVQASYSDETRCTRCGGVDGRAIGD